MSTPSEAERTMSIWDILPNITTLSVPFKRAGRFNFGGRATIVRLSTGNLAVFSPVTLTPTVQKKITDLGGQVSYLIAPDLEHHISLHSWHTAFPTAQIIAPEGLAEKRAGSSTYAKQPIPIASTIKASEKDKIQIDQDFDREFDVELVDAHPNKELVFLHRPSKTLIQADLFFNLPAKEQYSKVSEGPEKGIFSKFANYLLSTTGEALPQRRFLWYVLTAKDRAGFNRSVKRIASWDFENVIGCHGDAVLGQGKEVFERVMRWHLDAPEKKKAA